MVVPVEAVSFRTQSPMNVMESSVKRLESKETWSVVVVYDDTATRERAMVVCDHLVQQFWSEVEFKFHWWRTDFLEDAGMTTTAISDAADADFIIVCASAEGELSPMVNTWFESWIARRNGREGALIDLTEVGVTTVERALDRQACLRRIAHRAKMDYLTKVTPAMTGTLPDSFESAAIRAGEISSVLDEILHYSPPPSHYGLNE
jgi:hypothetical protein